MALKGPPGSTLCFLAQTYSEKPGHKFALNFDFEAMSVDDYDAVVIPGGRAPEYLALDPKVLHTVRQFEAQGKVIASICHGQQILAAAGLLKVSSWGCEVREGVACLLPQVRHEILPNVAAAPGSWSPPQNMAAALKPCSLAGFRGGKCSEGTFIDWMDPAVSLEEASAPRSGIQPSPPDFLGLRNPVCSAFCCHALPGQGKKCTAYPALKPLVGVSGGEWLEPDPISKCFTDGKLITGAAWPGHPEFIAQIMAALGTTVVI